MFYPSLFALKCVITLPSEASCAEIALEAIFNRVVFLISHVRIILRLSVNLSAFIIRGNTGL